MKNRIISRLPVVVAVFTWNETKSTQRGMRDNILIKALLLIRWYCKVEGRDAKRTTSGGLEIGANS